MPAFLFEGWHLSTDYHEVTPLGARIYTEIFFVGFYCAQERVNKGKTAG
jgi:hypothetical protein